MREIVTETISVTKCVIQALQFDLNEEMIMLISFERTCMHTQKFFMSMLNRNILPKSKFCLEVLKAKVLFTDCCRWQNFRPSLLRLVNNCVESIYKMQKTRTKVLPSATVGE